MEIALYILAALAAVGLILYIIDRRQRPEAAETSSEPDADSADSGCCGMHITCERDSLLAAISDKIEYYDDEELDAYAGRSADDYAADEIETFRDVMLTLKPDEIAGWARSLQLRGITLPQGVRDELIMLVADERAARAAHPVQ